MNSPSPQNEFRFSLISQGSCGGDHAVSTGQEKTGKGTLEKICTEKLGQVEAGMGKSRKDKAGKGTKTGWENVKMWGKQKQQGQEKVRTDKTNWRRKRWAVKKSGMGKARTGKKRGASDC